MRCFVCGSERPEDFSMYRTRICDDCMNILDYWYKEAFEDIRTRHKALRGHELKEEGFLKGLAEYVYTRQDEYNRGRFDK